MLSRFLILTSLIATGIMAGCGTSGNRDSNSTTLVASIPPIGFLVNEITGKDFPVEILVPPGSSPETYEPTPQQLIAAEKANLIFTVGLLDFERALSDKLNMPRKIVALSKGIDLLVESCGHGHPHGVDPHIWTSPPELKIMAGNIYSAIALLYPDSTKYRQNYDNLILKLDALNEQITNEIKKSSVKSFLIYHPALTYYARQYGLEQLSIEQDGKEPSAARLKELIDKAKDKKIRKILYQNQFPKSTVESMAKELGAEVVAINPFRDDAIRELVDITALIVE